MTRLFTRLPARDIAGPGLRAGQRAESPRRLALGLGFATTGATQPPSSDDLKSAFNWAGVAITARTQASLADVSAETSSMLASTPAVSAGGSAVRRAPSGLAAEVLGPVGRLPRWCAEWHRGLPVSWGPVEMIVAVPDRG
jgi:hypothetical protein